jgi:OOP family OmpA-OmpF porin
MISRTPTGGLVQVDRQVEPGFISADVATPAQDTAQEANRPAVQGTDVETALRQDGRLSLDDLSFGTGSSELSQGQYNSLTKLAAFLKANSDQTVALVGHTDAVGSLSANVALSTRRAASVMERLATAYGVPRSQMEAEGVGYLSPRASNLTELGRRTNRRVEVILTSTR